MVSDSDIKALLMIHSCLWCCRGSLWKSLSSVYLFLLDIWAQAWGVFNKMKGHVKSFRTSPQDFIAPFQSKALTSVSSRCLSFASLKVSFQTCPTLSSLPAVPLTCSHTEASTNLASNLMLILKHAVSSCHLKVRSSAFWSCLTNTLNQSPNTHVYMYTQKRPRCQ